ncbi:hypothetical protein [Providencia sp.]|nr:hypothetical protein [Providencia sp.]
MNYLTLGNNNHMYDAMVGTIVWSVIYSLADNSGDINGILQLTGD